MKTTITHPIMAKEADPVTEAGVQAARADLSAWRLAHGLNPDPDAVAIEVGPLAVVAAIIPRVQQLACNEAIDAAVETYGFSAVLKALRLVAAANGHDLGVR